MFPEQFDLNSFPDQTGRESKHKIHQLARDVIMVIQNAAELRGKLTSEEVLVALHAVCDEVSSVGVVSKTETWDAFVQEQTSRCRSKRCRFGNEFHLPNMDSPDCQACFELWELTR